MSSMSLSMMKLSEVRFYFKNFTLIFDYVVDNRS